MENVSPQVSDVLLADFSWFQYLYDEDGFSKKEKKKKRMIVNPYQTTKSLSIHVKYNE